MIRDPQDLLRYTPSERANHWAVGMAFILLTLSGLPFFHPAFFPLTQFFGGPVWARILHPLIGVIFAAAFLVMTLRFAKLNVITDADRQWLQRWREMVAGDDHNMPEQGKYNGGQKVLFWGLVLSALLLFVSGIVIWRAYFSDLFAIGLVRMAAVIHSVVAAVAIAMIMVHAYAAIWTKGTVRAMWYGTVTRAWAKQHHRAWYRQVSGDK